MAKKVKRLFEQFQPANYQLDLIPDRRKMTFIGSVIIQGKKVGPPSQRITLHQKDLTIISAKVTKHDKKGDQKINVSRVNTQQKLDELRLHTNEKIFAGNYSIEISFKGKVTRPMDGIYPCYFKHKGKEKILIATQFESHFARSVFPCIDEPEAKATFDLSLTTPAGETVVSNTPIKTQKTTSQKTKTQFETTPPMPTYLLAFIYGEMGYKEARTKRGVQVRTYATPDNVKLTDFALQTAIKCLEFYEDYFDIKYPLAKCDLLALPDFAAAGMENWGCITFSELAMLVDEKNTSLSSKQLVAMVVAHEVSHQWFGNLVTMKWWTDLWLNEGFATWMTHIAIDAIFPEWKIWTQFIVDEQQMAMRYDALENTRSIEVPELNHPDEIRISFDPPISYGKGSSIIHMLYHYLGPEVFQAGIQYYLKQHAYKNTITTDLWAALETVSAKPVKDFMHTWIAQPGFPIVQATVEDQSVTLAQTRFFINPKHKDLPEQKWPIPLLAEDEALNGALTNKHQKYNTPNTSGFKLNRGENGFYRVAYNASHLQRLGELINKGRLEPLDRLGLLNDLTECAKAGMTDTVEVLHFLNNFASEGDYAVWDAIASLIGSLKLVMDDEDLRPLMKPFILSLTAKQLARLGWQRKKDESHFDRLLRPIILGLAASADEPTITKKCLESFAKIKHSEELAGELRTTPHQGAVKRTGEIDPDLRGTVFGTVARKGGKAEFTKLVKLHNEAELSEERITLAAAITGFRRPELIKKALEMIDSKDVRLQDVAYWVSYSFANRHAKQLTWEWLKSHWTWLKDNIGSDLSFYYMPIYSGRAFSDERFLPEYKKFFESVMVPGLERPFKRGVEMIHWQSAWKERALPEVKTFFKAQSKNS